MRPGSVLKNPVAAVFAVEVASRMAVAAVGVAAVVVREEVVAARGAAGAAAAINPCSGYPRHTGNRVLPAIKKADTCPLFLSLLASIFNFYGPDTSSP